MRLHQKSAPIALLVPVLLAGCVTPQESFLYNDKTSGFPVVSSTVRQASGKKAVWIQNRHQAQHISKRVHALAHKKTISVETAVQIALLNNKGLQAAYTDLGQSAAEAWQQTLYKNPKISIGVLGIGAPELGLFRAIEGLVITNVLALLTKDRKIDIADTQFRKAQLTAAMATLDLAAQTRNAWIKSVSAFETVTYLNRAQLAADAASELAQQLGRTGAMGKGGQAREHVFFAELTGQKAQAVLAARLAKEELTRLLGLWGSEVDYFVPNALPRVPRRIRNRSTIESESLHKRIDLKIAKIELEAVAKSYGLTEATSKLTDLEIIAGVEAEREVETEYEIVAGDLEETKEKKTVYTPQVEIEFQIPIFDSGKPRLRKAELAYMKAANMLAAQAVNVRSEARSAYTNYRGTHQLAKHYKRNVLPLRTTIEEQALLTNNGMITTTFELLADTRAKINSQLLSVGAKREFWLADAGLNAVVYGGAVSGGSGGAAPAAVDGGGAGH